MHFIIWAILRPEGDYGEERADDEEEGGHDDEDDVAVGGDGAAAAVEGAEVRILADLGREFTFSSLMALPVF